MDSSDDRKKQKLIASFAVLFAVALIAAGEIVFAHKKAVPTNSMATVAVTAPETSASTQANATDTPAPTVPVAAPATTASQSGYKDGAYKATGSYISPAGRENITV